MTDRTAFGPAELDAMAAAFATALHDIADESSAALDLDAHTLGRRLAAGILAAAREGVIDPQDLASCALRGLQR